jgi:hypothetical protein
MYKAWGFDPQHHKRQEREREKEKKKEGKKI